MSLLVVNRDQVRQLLPMDECVEVMERALVALARGAAVQPLRTISWVPGKPRALGVMPALLDEPAVLGVKVISVFPDNDGSELESHQGAVLLFEAERGQPVALVDAGEITAVRTAAVSAVATRALARAEAGDLAILGAGTQARTHLEAMAAVRTLRRVRVWDVSVDRAGHFAATQGARLGLSVEGVATPQDAVVGADLVCTVSAATEPVVEGRWLAPGAHVNAVGACFPTARELDTEAVARALLVVDSRESALAESGDLLIPIGAGELSADDIHGELGEVLAGMVAGRTDDVEITVFESLGLAVEDVAAAHHVLVRAREEGVGVEVELGGRREG